MKIRFRRLLLAWWVKLAPAHEKAAFERALRLVLAAHEGPDVYAKEMDRQGRMDT